VLGAVLACAVLVLGLVGVGSATEEPPSPKLSAFAAPRPKLVPKPFNTLHLAPITEAQRRKGYNECYTPDPLGLGPYAPYRHLSMGRIAIPQVGGHTADMGYDVLIHFHGHQAARKVIVQIARGIVFVGIDKGIGSGAYADAFTDASAFPELLSSITHALVAYTGDARAHIRHLALSAWSAGYGAVNQILKQGDNAERIDAVVLLDALHAGWNPNHPHHDGSVESAESAYIQPVFDFAREAAEGRKIFVFTHSRIDPITYPSTSLTAALMLSDMGLKTTPVDSGDDPFGMTGRVDVRGFHLWAYRGDTTYAHCSHLSHLAPIVRDILEKTWQTPAMDRDVPPTPAPKMGEPERKSALADRVKKSFG
jgi:hypothetical protein